jgi:hypothetical protein
MTTRCIANYYKQEILCFGEEILALIDKRLPTEEDTRTDQSKSKSYLILHISFLQPSNILKIEDLSVD